MIETLKSENDLKLIVTKFLQLGLVGLLAVIFASCGGSAEPLSQPAAGSGPGAGATGEKFQFQFTCINRNLKTCDLMQKYADRVAEETNGRMQIQITSFPELGLAGPDTLRLLQDGTLDFAEIYAASLREACNAIGKDDVEKRWRANNRAIEIVSHLWSTLDTDRGGNISKNLGDLFPYMITRLAEVDVNNDPAPAEEVIGLLEPLRDSWRDLSRKNTGSDAGAAAEDVAVVPMRTSISA